MKVKIHTQLVILAVWLLAICPSFVYAQVKGRSAAKPPETSGAKNTYEKPDKPDAAPEANQPKRPSSVRREVAAPANNHRFYHRRANQNRPLESRVIPDFNNQIRPMQSSLRFEQASQRMQPIRKLNPAEYSFKNQRAPKINTLYKEQASLNPAFTKMADLSRSGSGQLNSRFSRMAKVSGRISGELNPALTIKLSSAFTKLGNLNRASSQLSSQFLRLAQASSLTKEFNSGFKKMAELSKQPIRLTKIEPIKFAKLQPDLTRLIRSMPQAKPSLINLKPETMTLAKLSVPAKATLIKPVQLPKLKPVSLAKPAYVPIASLKAPDYKSLKAYKTSDFTEFIRPTAMSKPVLISLKPKTISIIKLPAPAKAAVIKPIQLSKLKPAVSMAKTTVIKPIQLLKLKPVSLAKPAYVPIASLKAPDYKSLKAYKTSDFTEFIRQPLQQRQAVITGLIAKGENALKLQALDKWVTSYERLAQTSQEVVTISKTNEPDAGILLDLKQARIHLEQRAVNVNNLIAQGDKILEQFIVQKIDVIPESIYPAFEGIIAIDAYIPLQIHLDVGFPKPTPIPVISN